MSGRLAPVAKTAKQIAETIRPDGEGDEIAVELGVKIADVLNLWFVAKDQAGATVRVTLTLSTDT